MFTGIRLPAEPVHEPVHEQNPQNGEQRQNGDHVPIRWTLKAAGYEFGFKVPYLLQQLNAMREQPGADGCYSTKQIYETLWQGDKREMQRDRAASADLKMLRMEALKRSLIERKALEAGLEPLFIAIRQCLSTTEIAKQDQEDILSDLAESPIEIAVQQGAKEAAAV